MACEDSTSDKQRLAVVRRAGGRCEAELEVRGVWTRCFTAPVEVHHLLTRSRGGDVLDRMGEDYHLAALCHLHHRRAHAPGGYAAGMMIEGYVILDHATTRAVYLGPDEYLSATYPRTLERA